MSTVIEELLQRQGPSHGGSKRATSQLNVREELKRKRAASITVSARGSSFKRRPFFILCTSRSGSTLLRLRLNMHKDIACPPEMDLPHALSALEFVWKAIGGLEPGEPPMVRRKLRSAVSEPLDLYARERGKSIWCEKTPTNIDGVDLLLHAFPRARFICLYRHPMDMISSGIEACRWGYGAYGFDPYVRATPENIVLALARYWYEKSSRELRFENEHPSRCFRLYYETLVLQPETTLSSLLEWMSVGWDDSVLGPSIAPIADLGPGDHKTVFSQEISTESVGKGVAVPVLMIPAPILDGINSICSQLGYPAISESWNRSANPFFDDLASRVKVTATHNTEVVEILREGLNNIGLLGRPEGNGRGYCLRLIFDDVSRETSEWIMDFGARSVVPACSKGGEGDRRQMDFVVVAASRDFLNIAQRLVNAGELLRAGLLRISSLQTDSRAELQSFIHDFVALLRLGYGELSQK